MEKIISESLEVVCKELGLNDSAYKAICTLFEDQTSNNISNADIPSRIDSIYTLIKDSLDE